MHRLRSCSRVLSRFVALSVAVGLASLVAVPATTAGSTLANSSVCQPHVTVGVLPVWARAGFSDPRPRVPYSLGRAGKIAALLWANPLLSPRAAERAARIRAAARAAVHPADEGCVRRPRREHRLRGRRSTLAALLGRFATGTIAPLPSAPPPGTLAPRPAAPPGAARAIALGLSAHEYELIVARLEREPGEVELAMFSLLWSEHCSYKHSKPLLRTLPTEGPRLVLGPGENAGAVDVGGGLSVAFKVESHNHPSAVEPFQGAATGVGGILRDVFAVAARPIAILDSLRFGEPTSERSRYLLDRAVAGIGRVRIPGAGSGCWLSAVGDRGGGCQDGVAVVGEQA
jgi:hypothetical protein